ncbi:restriction endonuclease subunit S [Gemmatimonas sp.]|uniref:restriction endonuclease subunit S n=1 Tax=Gemmatimonas sp. TaxID=1962908 RepID=UPI0022C98324|nr:restriction endonuclease subunit S [Gemmatimonas sp.]MCZ8204666.1 restriction endonuclease subunit S [Gemmatimonas sp.]
MSFPRYPEYKDSGVEWLRKVPAHWDLARFKHILRERDERSIGGEEELLSVSAYTGVTPRSAIIEAGAQLTRAETLEGYKVCKRNDLVVNIMLAWNRGLGVTVHDGIVSPSYCVFEPNSRVYPRFLDYLVRCDQYLPYFKAHSAGVIDSRLRLYPDVLAGLIAIMPPLNEQRAIVDVLDHETAKIDALVAEQERLIALLKEKRQAVISHAVTKGLDTDAPVLASAVEELDAIPAHWAIHRMTTISTKITNGYVGPTRDILIEDGVRYLQSLHVKSNRILFDVPYFVSRDWSDEHAKSILQAGDVLIVQTGDIGQTAVVTPEFEGCNCHALIIVSPKKEVVEGAWISWVLNSSYGKDSLAAIQTGALHPHLNCGDVKDVVIPLPPLEEQRKVMAYLEQALDRIDLLVAEAQKLVEVLSQRRSALIAAAVTGQIDVRGLAPAEAA